MVDLMVWMIHSMSLADDASYPIGMIPAIKLEHLGLLIGCCSASIGVDPEHVLSALDVSD